MAIAMEMLLKLTCGLGFFPTMAYYLFTFFYTIIVLKSRIVLILVKIFVVLARSRRCDITCAQPA